MCLERWERHLRLQRPASQLSGGYCGRILATIIITKRMDGREGPPSEAWHHPAYFRRVVDVRIGAGSNHVIS